MLQSDDEQKMAIIRKAFQMFDTTKSGFIETIKIATILNTMGQLFDEDELNNLITKNDPDRTGQVNFDGFCDIANHFLEEDADDESTTQGAQGGLQTSVGCYTIGKNGYYNNEVPLRNLAALDDNLTSRDLDGIIAEIDTDGSGTVDFDEIHGDDGW
ncbi:hypothetical protein NQ318_023059 [Aromia moschata]|uniref:EF-hand domain-containing protein n=1 Tax=Aromia moschata TaxID=1265417 RepID=A0AAV8XYJ2_9CUCU|nr:hypothetical protein NQ318_023059 [Aromia moschata]